MEKFVIGRLIDNMVDKDKILKKVSKIEDKLLIAKVLDKAFKTQKAKVYAYTDFMDPYQKGLIEKLLAGESGLDFDFDGGYDGAERVITVFRPDFMSYDEDSFEMPFRLVDITFNIKESLNHRDFLGSLIGLGIKREKIGDILVREDGCSIVVLGDIAEYIKYNLARVGNVNVKVELKDMDDIQLEELEVKIINKTVASLRLDCIAAAGFGMSRNKVTEFINAEKVFVNWNAVPNTAKVLNEGDTISLRGKGRIILEEVGRTTKKGRIGISIKKLI